jgi:hypothetical protein
MIKSKRIVLTAAFILLAAVVFAVPAHAMDNTAVCNKALLKCGIDAVIAGLLSGGTVMLLISMGCIIGYEFCLKFYLAV